MMKRNHNTGQPPPNGNMPRFNVGSTFGEQQLPAASKSYESTEMAQSFTPPQIGHAVARVSNEGGMVCRPEEIPSILMQVSEKAERCWNFELQRHLQMYHANQMRDANFPEAAMLIASAAQIYGRKVDYLSDIIMHMDQDQKAREHKATEEKKGEDTPPEGTAKSVGRKRAGRFKPQELSDCFGDLEFTPSDNKLLKLESLVQPVTVVDVDRRTKVTQMQDHCTELRTNPGRQRVQEILGRLRDDACIVPLMTSHGTARKNAIHDLESGENIGSRYDFQIHLNYVDGRTGSLMAEHDLKRFFQRCDVMDFLSEQHVSERERCSQLGIPAPIDMLAVRERELKLFMPPEYLKDRYRINVHDTSDFDNALIQARVSNYNSDPILSLMDHAERAERVAKHTTTPLHDSAVNSLSSSPEYPRHGKNANASNDSGFQDDTTIHGKGKDISFDGVLSSSRVDESTDQEITDRDSFLDASGESSNENPVDEELVALEHSTVSATDESSLEKSSTLHKSSVKEPRLSVDEGIGVDRETPPLSGLSNLEEITSAPVLFTGGIVFPRPAILRPVRLVLNVLGLPEDLTRKHVQFALPNEYRKMKMDKVRRQADRAEDDWNANVYSLQPSESERPSTPDLEDFLGFEDETTNKMVTKISVKKSKSNSTSPESSPVRRKRPTTPEPDFEGFNDDEIDATRHAAIEQFKGFPARRMEPEGGKESTGTASQPVTPTRTLSCDSGISDTAERNAKDINTLKPIIEETDEFDCELPEQKHDITSSEEKPDHVQQQPLKEHTDASNARIQQSMDEAKERFDKVNQWHRKLKPILIEAENRKDIDIHAYGTEIIDTFDRNVPFGAESITLEKVLENKPPNSTALFFLSMLMLANTKNVQICNKNQDTLRLCSKAEIELRLLSRVRQHQEMQAQGVVLPSDNDADGDRRQQKSKQNRKRKAIHHDDQWELIGANEMHPCKARLGETPLDNAENDGFLERMQQMHASLNSDDSHRKRMAFRRGMRNCAYGLKDEVTNGTAKEPEKEPPTEEERTMEANPDRNLSRSRPPVFPDEALNEDLKEDLLSIDLLTNRATLAPAVLDSDPMCAKSVFSLAESGYESILSREDDT